MVPLGRRLCRPLHRDEGGEEVRILFLTPLIGIPKSEPPLGLCYIQACLDKAGYKENKIVDIYNSYDDLEKIIREYNPDAVGIACFTTYRNSSYKLADIVKKINPGIKTFLGGPHSTFMWEQIMKNYANVDFIVIGEAEITAVELIKAIDKGLPLRDVQGIVFREDGNVIKTEDRPLIKDLDELPFPSYRDIELKKYAIPCPPTTTTNEVKANIVSSRGCYGNCTFCSTKVFWGNWRARTAKNVVDEIEWLYNTQNVRFFSFSDDIFTTDIKRVIDICNDIVARGLKIKWFCETRVNNVSLELFESMKKAGCYLVQFGVESGSDKILKNINKNVTKDQIINAFKLAKQAGLQTEILIMVGNQGEDWSTIKETEELFAHIDADILIISITHIFPATRLYDLAKEHNIIDDDFWLTDKTIPEYTVDNSVSELMKMRLDVVKKFYKSKGRLAFYRYVIGQIRKNPRILQEHFKIMFK
jgi:anaerobic magnesium-protoporphyrin IX monomethyl ester cyclase